MVRKKLQINCLSELKDIFSIGEKSQRYVIKYFYPWRIILRQRYIKQFYARYSLFFQQNTEIQKESNILCVLRDSVDGRYQLRRCIISIAVKKHDTFVRK